MTLEERLNKAEAMIQKPSFRQNKGLGNEVGYYIFDYPAEQELFVRERVEYIRKKNEQSTDEYKIMVFDLYEIIIEILKDKANTNISNVIDGNADKSKYDAEIKKLLSDKTILAWIPYREKGLSHMIFVFMLWFPEGSISN